MKYKMTNLNLHKKKWFIVFILIMPVIMIVIINIHRNYNDKRLQREYDTFYALEFNDEISKL
jgi:hypothetical protein